MAKLVQKSGYIKSEKAGGYMKYIATREGVEKLTGNGPVTKGQQELIQKLLHDFPDAVELFEYEDYRKTPTLGTASAFITMALDANLHEINSESGYLSYIATRPRVERRGAHGLFNSAAAVDLDAAMSELEAHDGNVWTIIYSLRREDAARLGYDNADAWRGLLMMHAQDLAKAMKIPADHFRWYAAFHNEGHHPHIHMMVWSDDPKEGFLTREGIAAMRSKLTNTIFRDEMIQIYERKDVAYKELIEAAQDTMRELIQKMEHLHTSRRLYLGPTPACVQTLLDNLWQFRDSEEVGLLKLLSAQLLWKVERQSLETSPAVRCFTSSQVAIAREIQNILCADLSQNHTARELAERFQIAETSLKNYFRGVFGENVSTFLREARMRRAAELLQSSELRVAEIAAQVGYENQSKFAAVFVRRFGYPPLEYRRRARLSIADDD